MLRVLEADECAQKKKKGPAITNKVFFDVGTPYTMQHSQHTETNMAYIRDARRTRHSLRCSTTRQHTTCAVQWARPCPPAPFFLFSSPRCRALSSKCIRNRWRERWTHRDWLVRRHCAEDCRQLPCAVHWRKGRRRERQAAALQGLELPSRDPELHDPGW